MDFQQEQQLEDSNNKAPLQPTFNTNSASPSRPISESRIAQEGNNTHTTLVLSPKEKTSHITIDKSNLPPPYPLQPNSDHCVNTNGSKAAGQQYYPQSNTSHLKKCSNSGSNTPNCTPKSKHRRSEMNIQDNNPNNNQRSIYETHYSSAQSSPIEQIRRPSTQVNKKEQHITVTYSECVNPMSFQTEPSAAFHPTQPNITHTEDPSSLPGYQNCVCCADENNVALQNLCHHHQQENLIRYYPSSGYQPQNICVHTHYNPRKSDSKRYSNSFRTTTVDFPVFSQHQTDFCDHRHSKLSEFNLSQQRKFTNYSASAEAMILIHPFSCERLAILAIISTLTCLATLLTGAIFYIWILPR